jgi:hypothetical protein
VVVRFSRSAFEGDDDRREQRARTDAVEVSPRVEGEAIYTWSEGRPVSHQRALPPIAVRVAAADDAPGLVAGAPLQDNSDASRGTAARGIEHMRRDSAHVPRILYEPAAGYPRALAAVEDHLAS